MNSILVAIPVCHKDVDLVIGNLQRLAESEGRVNHPAIVAYDSEFKESDAAQVKELAERCFSRVEILRYQARGNNAWPVAPNWAWQTVARHIEQKSINSTVNPFMGAIGWLWWEADALIIRAGCFNVLAEQYRKCGKPFFGNRVKDDGHMNGVAIYPFLISNHCEKAMLVRSSPFDTTLSQEARLKIADAGDFILHEVKAHGGARPRRITKDELRALPETAVLFHGVMADDSASSLAVDSFYMSGDLGDVIYALPGIKSMGGGVLYLGPEETHVKKCREPISEARFKNIAPLLKAQPYLSEVIYAPSFPKDKAKYDLNHFRQYYIKDFDLKKSLCHVILDYMKQPHSACEEPWIEVDKPEFKFPVIVARSQRYQEKTFPWKAVVKKYSGSIGFVGTTDEYSDFVNTNGFVPYVPTPTMLDLARVISGCSLFIGNQSAPYAVAEALKKRTIQETWTQSPNCVFERSTAYYITDKKFSLPDISKEAMGSKRLVIQGHVNGFSGYGQAISSFIRELTILKHHVDVLPTAIDKQLAPVPKHFTNAIISNCSGSKLVFHTFDAFPALLQKGDAVFTMWESTRINKAAIDALNEKARVLILPNVWNASCFDAAGVTIPIRLVPLGVDPEIFFYRKDTSKSKATVFGTAGRFAHGGSRKGLEEVIEAFKEAFPNESSVRLRVKLFSDCKVNETGDPRISFDREFLKPEDLAWWYSGLTAFISASKAEGWGLHHLQAMAVGRPIACAQFSGVTEFFDASVGYPIEFDLKPCDGFYNGMGLWGVPRKESIIEVMRRIHGNHKEAEQLGIKAAERAKLFTWRSAAEKLERVLIEFGML